MSTHGTPGPPGSTYYAASYRAQGPAGGPAPAEPDASPSPGVGTLGQGFPAPGPSPVPVLPPSGGDPFPPLDTSGFGPGPAPGTGYAVPGQGVPAAAPARRNGGLPIVIGVLAVVLVLCIGGGAAAYFFFVAGDSPADRPDQAAATATPSAGRSVAATPKAATPSATKQPGGGEEEVSGDLSGFRQGDCLTVDETDDNKVEKATCTDPGARKVLLRKDGTLDDSVCESTEATFSLSQDASGTTRDFVLCVGPVD